MDRADILKIVIKARLNEMETTGICEDYDRGREHALRMILSEIEKPAPVSGKKSKRSFLVEHLSLFFYRANVVETAQCETLASITLDFFIQSGLVDDSEIEWDETMQETLEEQAQRKTSALATAT